MLHIERRSRACSRYTGSPKQRQLRAKTTSENAGVQYLPVGFEATGVFGGYLRKDFPSCQGANRE
jgi:hypothetical protein